MKMTIRAILIDVEDKQKQVIDELMTVFCSAVRYSYKRINEALKGDEIKEIKTDESKRLKIGDLEKEVAKKYTLNIRQAKDAVENARQTASSQKELVKMNYENYSKKVIILEKRIKNKNLSKNKKQKLQSKLEKRKLRQAYFKKYIDSRTIPPVTFGTKKLFISRCKGLITHEKWVDARTNRIYSRGDKTKNGNPNLRVVTNDGKYYLEISTLQKTEGNRAIKIRVPIYLPEKLSKKTGRINGIPYKKMFLGHLASGEAYQIEMIRREGKYYCHITFERENAELKYTGHEGIVGVDTNPDGFGLTVVDKKGNYKEHKYLRQHELLYARSNRRKNLCGELCKKVVNYAKEKGLGVAVEDLKFRDDKDVGNKFARIKHQFIYALLLIMLRSACLREGVGFINVKPQYTSKIGLYKYCHQYGMAVHNGAAMVIGRRSYKLKEKIPKLLKDKYVEYKKSFDKHNEWKRWIILSNYIKKREDVKRPDYWIENRKKLLEAKSCV